MLSKLSGYVIIMPSPVLSEEGKVNENVWDLPVYRIILVLGEKVPPD